MSEKRNKLSDAFIDMVTKGEASRLRGQRTTEVINPGLNHPHIFKIVEWDKKYGDSVTDFTEFTANFKRRLICACGAEEIRGERALY